MSVNNICLFSKRLLLVWFPFALSIAANPPDHGFVFLANLDGNWDLVFSNADGSDAVRLTRTGLDELSPAISPDGLRLAYGTSDGALWTMSLATQKVIRVPLVAGRYGHPTWLADASGIIF